MNYNITFLSRESEVVSLPAEDAAAHCPPSALTLSNRGSTNIATSIIQVSSFERFWKDSLVPAMTDLISGPVGGKKPPLKFFIQAWHVKDQHIRWTQFSLTYPSLKQDLI